jgi:hypothetical protein
VAAGLVSGRGVGESREAASAGVSTGVALDAGESSPEHAAIRSNAAARMRTGKWFIGG